MTYIVIIGQVVGGNGRGFEIAWSSDHERFSTIKQAISHGFQTRGSDDFRIGHVQGLRRLANVSFMGEKFFDQEEVQETAYQIGLN